MTESEKHTEAAQIVTQRPTQDAARTPVTLLVDADDTLWENNIYFLGVTAQYVAAVSDHGVPRDEAIRVLSEIERRNIEELGYGSQSFAESIVAAYRVLAGTGHGDIEEYLRAEALSIFFRESMELRPGVSEALEQLSSRFRLFLVTKGDKDEQERKLARSGLGHHFEWVEIVAEKDVSTYVRILADRGLDRASTWMVGNSPRSDINPALAAGLGAVFIPHPDTWDLELDDIEVPPGACYFEAGSLLDLVDHPQLVRPVESIGDSEPVADR